MVHNFCRYALDNGATLKPILVNSKDLKGPSISNPTVLVDGDKIYCNLRNLNYTMYHSELKKFEHQWGPLIYVHPENDVTLTTHNIMGELNSTLDFVKYSHIDTSKLDQKPIWEFIGLEDCRLIKWDDKLYVCGVRRDTTPNGVGRMEMSEIVYEDHVWKEVARYRLPAPGKNNTYCEKNWMPILDKPYHFIKWSNPTEVVKVNLDDLSCETVFVGEKVENDKDWRGNSQVIPFGDDHYIAYVHECDLWFDECQRKDSIYRHRFLVWDKDFNLVKYSPLFTFLDTWVEFGCGMDRYKDGYILTFGAQDNTSFVMTISHEALEKFVYA